MILCSFDASSEKLRVQYSWESKKIYSIQVIQLSYVPLCLDCKVGNLRWSSRCHYELNINQAYTSKHISADSPKEFKVSWIQFRRRTASTGKGTPPQQEVQFAQTRALVCLDINISVQVHLTMQCDIASHSQYTAILLGIVPNRRKNSQARSIKQLDGGRREKG